MQQRTGKHGPMAYDINTRIALGALNAGIGQTQVNSFFSCLNVPSVDHVTFKVREREVGKAIESVAEASCLESCSEERKRAVGAGVQGDDQNLIGVLVLYDMGWQKRGKAHNSSSGPMGGESREYRTSTRTTALQQSQVEATSSTRR